MYADAFDLLVFGHLMPSVVFAKSPNHQNTINRTVYPQGTHRLRTLRFLYFLQGFCTGEDWRNKMERR